MKLSLRYLRYAIDQAVSGDVRLDRAAPGLRYAAGLSMLRTAGPDDAEKLLFDFGDNSGCALKSPCNIITTESRASLFEGHNRIVIPDSGSMQDAFDSVLREFGAFSEWTVSLYQQASRGVDLAKLLELTSAIEKNPMWICDPWLRDVAEHEQGSYGETSSEWRFHSQFGYLPFHVVDSLSSSGELKFWTKPGYARLVKRSEAFTNPYIVRPIFKDGVHYGSISIIQYVEKLTERDLEIADWLGNIIADSSYTQDKESISSNDNIGFLEDMLRGKEIEQPLFDEQVKALGLKEPGDYAVVVIGEHADTEAKRHLTAHHVRNTGLGPCLVFDGDVVILVNDYQAKRKRAHVWIDSVLKNCNQGACISEPFESIYDLKVHYEQARYGTKYAQDGLSASRLICYTDVFHHHLSNIVSAQLPRYPKAQTLIDYDAENGTELCKTLLIWSQESNNATHAAQRLCVHRNTVIQRIDKARALLEEDLASLPICLRLILDLQAHFDAQEAAEAKPEE